MQPYHTSIDTLLEDVEEMYDGDWQAAYEYLDERHEELEDIWEQRQDGTFSMPDYVLDQGTADNLATTAGVVQGGLLIGDAAGSNDIYVNAVSTLLDGSSTPEDVTAALTLAAVPIFLSTGINGIKKRVAHYKAVPGYEDVERYRVAKEQVQTEKLE